jgi:hypothetical protein
MHCIPRDSAGSNTDRGSVYQVDLSIAAKGHLDSRPIDTSLAETFQNPVDTELRGDFFEGRPIHE